jgi:hypothetical protein
MLCLCLAYKPGSRRTVFNYILLKWSDRLLFLSIKVFSKSLFLISFFYQGAITPLTNEPLLFATMATKQTQEINAMTVTLSCGLFLICIREEYVQYYTIIHSGQY